MTFIAGPILGSRCLAEPLYNILLTYEHDRPLLEGWQPTG